MTALALGPAARAADVVRLCFEDMPGLAEKVVPLTWPTALRLPDDRLDAVPRALTASGGRRP